jgi:hypothetical protein
MVKNSTNVIKIDIPPLSLWRRFWDAVLKQELGAKSVTTEIQARGYGVSLCLKRTYQSLGSEK